MQIISSTGATKRRTPVPRGLARTGPAILSYGFRPFFLLAASFALIDMIAWIGALSGYWSVGGAAGPVAWHAHEMLFGYGTAALCGFALTAIPNWTGRLPVSGGPLLALVLVWLAGRAAMAFPGLVGEPVAAAVDGLFLPALAIIVAREVIVGHNVQNLRLAVVVGALACLNLAFHVAGLTGAASGPFVRATVGAFVLLICLIGGRIIPSFTRNVLARRGDKKLPSPIGRYDQLSLLAVLVATVAWAIAPETAVTAALAGVAALSQAVRLARWRPLQALSEPLLAMLHVAFVFVPLGWLGVALAALGLMPLASAVHVLTVGAIGGMTMAVMARATRGHTGRPLRASVTTVAAFALLVAATMLRPAADLVPQGYDTLLALAAVAWIGAFALFLVEHGPMLLLPTLGPQNKARARPAGDGR
jgi:uncharacterized protein involved in response to NO